MSRTSDYWRDREREWLEQHLKDEAKYAKEVQAIYDYMLDEIEKYAKQLDLGEDIDWAELKNYVRQSVSDKETSGKIASDILAKTGIGAFGGAIVGGLHGAVLSGVASLALAITQATDSGTRTREAAYNIRSLYLNVLNNLTEEAKSRL